MGYKLGEPEVEKSKPRAPKIDKLPDGSLIIEGFVAPPPKMAPSAPAKFATYEYAENASNLAGLDKPEPVFSTPKPILDDKRDKD